MVVYVTCLKRKCQCSAYIKRRRAFKTTLNCVLLLKDYFVSALPREVVESLSLEGLKNCGDVAVRDVVSGTVVMG